MRLNALLMVVLVASMPGSLAYTNISTNPDMSKMSNELISELDSSEELEVIIQFTGEQDSSVWKSLESLGIEMISEIIKWRPHYRNGHRNIPIIHFFDSKTHGT